MSRYFDHNIHSSHTIFSYAMIQWSHQGLVHGIANRSTIIGNVICCNGNLMWLPGPPKPPPYVFYDHDFNDYLEEPYLLFQDKAINTCINPVTLDLKRKPTWHSNLDKNMNTKMHWVHVDSIGFLVFQEIMDMALDYFFWVFICSFPTILQVQNSQYLVISL